MKHLLLSAIVALLSTYCIAQEKSNYIDSLERTVADMKEELFKIEENYYMIQPYGIAGNIGVYVGKEEVILVDDQYYMLTPRIREILGTITTKPIRYIINTHYHFDHTSGNKSFGKDKIPIIAHTKTRQRLSSDQVLTPTMVQKAYPPEALPTITFTDSLQLHDGMEAIELIHFPNAHTDGDIIIHFKKADIYHTGDIFVTYGLPAVDENNGGNIYGIITAVEKLISISTPRTKFIPGHGPVCSIKEVMEYKNLLVSITDQVAGFIKKKLTIEQIIKAVKIDENIKGVSKENFIGQVYRMTIAKKK